jgi:3',5'-cyclic AMP phosphodiesterase CpdA
MVPIFSPMRLQQYARRAAVLATGVLAAACSEPPPRVDATLVAAGDIAGCWWRWDDATGRLLDRVGGEVIALGDIAYQQGTAAQLTGCYGPNWGRHKARTHPVIGNHDARTEHGAAYYAYFGDAAGPIWRGWYSWELKGWHMVAINSELPTAALEADQLRWLEADLRTHPTRCALAYMHRPPFSSGQHGNSARMSAVLGVLYRHGVDVILSGHDHDYERFAPQDTLGRADPAHGIVQFVVGTGGAPLYRPGTPRPNSRTFNSRVHGVLAMRLREDGYDWEFVPTRRGVFEDHGSERCR